MEYSVLNAVKSVETALIGAGWFGLSAFALPHRALLGVDDVEAYEKTLMLQMWMFSPLAAILSGVVALVCDVLSWWVFLRIALYVGSKCMDWRRTRILLREIEESRVEDPVAVPIIDGELVIRNNEIFYKIEIDGVESLVRSTLDDAARINVVSAASRKPQQVLLPERREMSIPESRSVTVTETPACQVGVFLENTLLGYAVRFQNFLVMPLHVFKQAVSCGHEVKLFRSATALKFTESIFPVELVDPAGDIVVLKPHEQVFAKLGLQQPRVVPITQNAALHVIGLSDGTLRKNFGVAKSRDKLAFLHSASTQPGYSGAAVLGSGGALLGVHLGAKEIRGVNYGYPAQLLERILRVPSDTPESFRTDHLYKYSSYLQDDREEGRYRNRLDFEERHKKELDDEYEFGVVIAPNRRITKFLLGGHVSFSFEKTELKGISWADIDEMSEAEWQDHLGGDQEEEQQESNPVPVHTATRDGEYFRPSRPNGAAAGAPKTPSQTPSREQMPSRSTTSSLESLPPLVSLSDSTPASSQKKRRKKKKKAAPPAVSEPVEKPPLSGGSSRRGRS